MIEAKLILNRTRGGAPLFGAAVGDRTIYFRPLDKIYEEDARFVDTLAIAPEVFALSPGEFEAVGRVYEENRDYVANFFDSLVYNTISPQISFLPWYRTLKLNRKESERLQLAISQITYIYLIRDKATGCVKIGRSRDPEARLKQLVRQDTLMPKANEFTMLFYWRGYTTTEKFLHMQYAEKHVRGEWFDLDEEDVEEIKKFYFNQD